MTPWVVLYGIVLATGCIEGVVDDLQGGHRWFDGEPAETPTSEAGKSGATLDFTGDATYCVGDGAPWFEDMSEATGLVHTHETAADARTYDLATGGGAALFDLEGDGDLDLYVSNAQGRKGLFVQRIDRHFEDMADWANAAWPEDVTLGVSAIDYDNDGDTDLYLLNHGPNRLLENLGDGRFADATERAGLGVGGRSASASWGDYNRDGHLDVLVAQLASDWPSRGQPTLAFSQLFRGIGDGSFVEMTSMERLPLRAGASYVGSLMDLDDDWWPDVFLPQEFGADMPNLLLQNTGNHQGDSTFVDVSDDAGVNFPDAVMGLAVLDVNQDSLPDLYLTNLWGEAPNQEVLLQNGGALRFVDVTNAMAAGALVGWDWEQRFARAASWGAVALDANNDGHDDLYVAYGEFPPGNDASFSSAGWPPAVREQPNAFFKGGPEGFTLLGGTCAEDRRASRGVVAGDIDQDGCVDLIIVNLGAPLRYLRNRCLGNARSVTLTLVDTRGNRDALGARVRLRVGDHWVTRWVSASTTALHGSHARQLHFGLGEEEMADEVEIRWPDGLLETHFAVPSGFHRIVRE